MVAEELYRVAICRLTSIIHDIKEDNCFPYVPHRTTDTAKLVQRLGNCTPSLHRNKPLNAFRIKRTKLCKPDACPVGHLCIQGRVIWKCNLLLFVSRIGPTGLCRFKFNFWNHDSISTLP